MTPTGPMIKVLSVVSLLCGLLIVGTKFTTQARIHENEATMKRELVMRLLPGFDKQVVYSVEDSGELKVLPNIEGDNVKRLFAGYDKAGNLLGVVIEASDRGYADLISAMYAYSPEHKQITGFQVVTSKETPGLGSRIATDEEFAKNFNSLDAADPARNTIQAVKHGTKKNPWQIDAISGATISSRAVGRMLQKSVVEMQPVIEKNLDRIKRGN